MLGNIKDSGIPQPHASWPAWKDCRKSDSVTEHHFIHAGVQYWSTLREPLHLKCLRIHLQLFWRIRGVHNTALRSHLLNSVIKTAPFHLSFRSSCGGGILSRWFLTCSNGAFWLWESLGLMRSNVANSPRLTCRFIQTGRDPSVLLIRCSNNLNRVHRDKKAAFLKLSFQQYIEMVKKWDRKLSRKKPKQDLPAYHCYSEEEKRVAALWLSDILSS